MEILKSCSNNKAISDIQYNHLNLPMSVNESTGDGHVLTEANGEGTGFTERSPQESDKRRDAIKGHLQQNFPEYQ